MSGAPRNLTELNDKVRSEADAYLLMEQMRWGDRPVCPHCGSEHVTYIRPLNGVSRTTRTGSVSERRVWKCQACPGRKQFSVLTGTIFHGTKIPVRTWLAVIFEMCASKNGVAAREIERKYGLAPKTAWHMLHRIREAMQREPLAGLLGGGGGVVVADETYIGGSIERMNKKQRNAAETPHRMRPGGQKTGGPGWNKASVLSLIDTTTGEVRSKVVRDVTGATLRKAIADQVNMATTVLHTDEARAYNLVGSEFLAHETVNHKQG